MPRSFLGEKSVQHPPGSNTTPGYSVCGHCFRSAQGTRVLWALPRRKACVLVQRVSQHTASRIVSRPSWDLDSKAFRWPRALAESAYCTRHPTTAHAGSQSRPEAALAASRSCTKLQAPESLLSQQPREPPAAVQSGCSSKLSHVCQSGVVTWT